MEYSLETTNVAGLFTRKRVSPLNSKLVVVLLPTFARQQYCHESTLLSIAPTPPTRQPIHPVASN